MDIEKIRNQIVLYNPKLFPTFHKHRRKKKFIKFLTALSLLSILLVIGFILVNIFSPSSKRSIISIVGYAEGQIDIFTEKLSQEDTILSMPTMGRISSGFGDRGDPFTGDDEFHKGLDIAANEDTPIYAAASGIVTRTGTQNLAGNYVIIEHANGIKTKYFHCNQVLVSVGDRVDKNTVIALVGSTGNSTGPHLHFEVYVNDEVVNPMTLIYDND